MSRNKIILLNKANEALKILSDKYIKFELQVTTWEVFIIIQNQNVLSWEVGEILIDKFKQNNTNWLLKFENNNIVLKIWM